TRTDRLAARAGLCAGGFALSPRFFAPVCKKGSRFCVNCAILTVSAPAELAEIFYLRGQKHRYAYVEQQQ
ncbi:MAG: hypothetical protein MR540_08315, partial [Clostridiales bacterium]|nr:hypothetical protein [Clostridiales bacterium]